MMELKQYLMIFLLIMWIMHFSSFFINIIQIEKAEWLLGTWENKTQRGSIYETWAKVSEVEFFGKSFTLKENDTLVLETIQLIEKPEGLAYIPTLKNQNSGLPVNFSLKAISGNTLIPNFPKNTYY